MGRERTRLRRPASFRHHAAAQPRSRGSAREGERRYRRARRLRPARRHHERESPASGKSAEGPSRAEHMAASEGLAVTGVTFRSDTSRAIANLGAPSPANEKGTEACGRESCTSRKLRGLLACSHSLALMQRTAGNVRLTSHHRRAIPHGMGEPNGSRRRGARTRPAQRTPHAPDDSLGHTLQCTGTTLLRLLGSGCRLRAVRKPMAWSARRKPAAQKIQGV